MTAVECDAGYYRDKLTNRCKPCKNCSREAFYNDGIVIECRQANKCPQWCGVEDYLKPGEEAPVCGPVPTTTPQPTTPTDEYTTGYAGGSTNNFVTSQKILPSPSPSPGDHPNIVGSTNNFVTSQKILPSPSPSPGDQPNIVVYSGIIGVLVGVIVIAVIMYIVKKLFHKYGKNRFCYFRIKKIKSTLKTQMVDPEHWHLNIVLANSEGPDCRFWLTVTNTVTQERVVTEQEWRRHEGTNLLETMDIPLPPGGGSFIAELGINKQINQTIKWIDRLAITVPDQPCTCSVDSLMAEVNGVYRELKMDMRKSDESVKRIAKIMGRNESEINSIIAESAPFDSLLLLVTAESVDESDFNLSHIIMGLTCAGNDMTEAEKRAVKYLLRWHTCRMCHNIWAHNTGARPQTETFHEFNMVV